MRRGKLRITLELLKDLLNLPNNITVEAAISDLNTRTVDIYLADPLDDSLFYVGEGQEIPCIGIDELTKREMS